MKAALVFSGQGSQYVGMFKDIYEKYETARNLVDIADEILGFDLSDICFNGPIEILKETKNTQPAIFLHSALIYTMLKEKLEFQATAGHSVGEYAALFASGVISFEDGLKLVRKRGELMFSAGLEKPGTMFAVINLADDKVVDVCNELTEKGNGNVVVAANFNSPGQVVVSGSAQYLRENIAAFKSAGARMTVELPVSGAFHSPLLESAKNELAEAINNTEFHTAKVPVYSNVFATALFNSSKIKDALIKQLTAPVKWTQSLNTMKNEGFTKFIEIGPGSVLQGLVKRTLTEIETFGFDKVADLEKYL